MTQVEVFILGIEDKVRLMGLHAKGKVMTCVFKDNYKDDISS